MTGLRSGSGGRGWNRESAAVRVGAHLPILARISHQVATRAGEKRGQVSRSWLTAAEVYNPHWDGSQVQVEPGFPPAAIEALGGRWSVNEWFERNVYFGGVHAVAPREAGAGDPMRCGDAQMVVAGRGRP